MVISLKSDVFHTVYLGCSPRSPNLLRNKTLDDKKGVTLRYGLTQENMGIRIFADGYDPPFTRSPGYL